MEAFATDAILANDAAALRVALRFGADVNGMTPCHNVSTGDRVDGQFPLLSIAAFNGRAGICEILLAEGADPSLQSTMNPFFPLHMAAHNGSTACLCLLLRAGADVNARGIIGATPLHIASQHGRSDAAKLLIAAGANLLARDQHDFTPLRVAIYSGQREVALTLLRAGAAITVLRTEWIKPENEALQNDMVDLIHDGGWNARVERHRRPLMSILSNLALPHDALRVILSFWSPPGGS